MIKELDQRYIAGTYARFPVEIVSGHGSVAVDDTGKEYIDMGTGIGVNAFGIADPEWQKAVTEQLGKVQHTSNLFYSEPCVRLAQLLCEKTGMKKVFFNNSGAEANECAIKIARGYAAKHKGPEYSTIITLTDSFHGRTLTTLAATGQDHYHELFGPLTPGFVHVAPGDAAALHRAVEENPAAGILIECIQGEGGVNVLDPSYVWEVAAVCRKHNLVFMVDEVQTGNGRTGQLYAYMNYGVKPDVVTTAKGLAGGLPIGATLFGEKVQDVFGPGDNGSTFGGNPVACAGGVSILSRIDAALLADVRKKGAFLHETFTGAPGIEAVTGIGLMVGLKTTKPPKEVVARCIENGVLCLTANDKVRLLPALTIGMDELEKAAAVIKAACAE